jgi:hypothetical protein
MGYVASGNTRAGAGDMQWPDSPLATPRAQLTIGASPRHVVMPTSGFELRTPAKLEASGGIGHVTPPVDTPDIDEEAEGAPLRFRLMSNLIGGGQQQRGADTQLTEQLLVAIGDEPATEEEALVSKP